MVPPLANSGSPTFDPPLGTNLDDLELGLDARSHDSAATIEEHLDGWQGHRKLEDSEDALSKDEEITEVVGVYGLSEPELRQKEASRPPTPPLGIRHQSITSFEAAGLLRLQRAASHFLASHPKIAHILTWLRGAQPSVAETSIKPLLPRTEAYFARLLAPVQRARFIVIPLFLIAWFLAFTFLVRASWFNSTTSAGGAPTWLNADTSFWDQNAGCGINGTYCVPNESLLFRCPAQTLDVQLLNDRAVGPLEVIYKPLVVGGLDSLATYRADSWICPSAIHHGLFGNGAGGCGKLVQVGEFTGFVGGKQNGVESVSFDTTFVSSYRFMEGVSQADCADIRNEILGFNVAMTTILSFIIRPAASIFYWVLLIAGFWHVVLVSDPSATPPDIATGFQYFLPTLFVGYALWRFSWRWVVPAFDGAILERTVWYLGGYWVGVLINTSLAWIPISRLTPHDIQQEPGGLVAVIAVVVFLFLAILNQLRIIRRTGWLFFYVGWYVVGGIVICLLLTLPDLEFRFHHYFAGIVLMPGCAFVTRPSALFQGFLLGMFLDGAARWGFDSILQTPASLVGDGSLGSALPTFLTSAANFTVGQTMIYWAAIPENLVGQWDSFGLIVDDVLQYAGTETNFSLASVDASLPHYLRIAYILDGSYGDFTRAATAFIFNGTWIDAVAGAS